MDRAAFQYTLIKIPLEVRLRHHLLWMDYLMISLKPTVHLKEFRLTTVPR